ncbi:MFS transporter [Rhodohalobacter sp. SW132]|uniref:CynX/NimT family MFS transporter n=1 Tax=Rhodohalobacter sp. SW132 TaxID=2293433 RepID=UPI000E286DD5|nr:MFS transporter [Rhodohalobacter sp. SW132]REL38478.1 MFS transporter [Rhodohalobacter sp. SW132]
MSPEQNRKILLILAIAVIAFNLRPSISAVGPLISEIRSDTGLSNSLLGMLTTLPVLAFGILSVFTPLFTKRLGTEGTMMLALIILTAGILLRVIPGSLMLFGGTIILGAGIALGNVLLPGIVKKQFPTKTGLVTGIYSGMLGIGAALSSGVSVPLSENAGFGWRWALGFWALFSSIAVLTWFPQLKRNFQVIAKRPLGNALKQLSQSGLAWNVSLFMGFQSFTFYIIIAWLPEVLQDRGISAMEAGWMLSLCQGMGVLGTFFMPAWAERLENQHIPILVLIILEILSLLWLMIPGTAFTGVIVSLLGFSMGGSFGMALLFIVLRTRDSDSANELSGISQSVGYTLAATGPALFGAVFDIAQVWTVPLGMLLLFSFLKLWSGWKAGDQAFV